MTPTIEARVAVFQCEDLHRLANQAERDGVRILATRTGAHYATDDVDATRLHSVTPDGCDCNRFRWFGRCGHHSLLLAELGMIGDAGQGAVLEAAHDRWNELVDAGAVCPLSEPIRISMDRELPYVAD